MLLRFPAGDFDDVVPCRPLYAGVVGVGGSRGVKRAGFVRGVSGVEDFDVLANPADLEDADFRALDLDGPDAGTG